MSETTTTIKPLAYTPAEAVKRIGSELVTESWLRRQAGRRTIPSTLVGGRLGFSEDNIAQIIQARQRSVRPTPPR